MKKLTRVQKLICYAVCYTGTTGEPIPVVKGWLRVSLRVVNESSPYHTDFMPHREYRSVDVQRVDINTAYTVDIELWPTNVILAPGNTLELQVSSSDTAGSGLFNHTHPEDRDGTSLRGLNNVHLGGSFENFLRLPIIPKRE